MSLSSIFKIHDSITPSVMELLNGTTMGTNGAMYRHLDTGERIMEADNPLFLTMERNGKVISNVTFCKRGDFWYIRYFAFSSLFKSGTKQKTSKKGNSFLKAELNNFYNDVFEGKYSEKPIRSMYAYIDPKNDRSKWMSENFGFKVIGHLATQTYSRINPKISNRLSKESNWNLIENVVLEQYGDYAYFFTTHIEKPPFYCLKNDKNEIIAFAKVTNVHWEIVRLPGKLGGVLTKAIPYIPILNRLIKPKDHTFIVPEIVYVKANDPKLLDELFNGILFAEKRNLILWWSDQKDRLYSVIKGKMKWGILHKIVGVTPVDVVERKHPENNTIIEAPVFVSAWDFI